MAATVCAEVSSTGEGSETDSMRSHSSQASIPEEEINIWVDEMEEQNSKRQKLNEAVHGISGGRYSPVLSTLNTTWDAVSDTQQRYYIRKAKETIATSLSVIIPGQKGLVWKTLQMEILLDPNRGNQGKRKRFDPNSGLVDILVKAYEQAGNWQTKRQTLSLFADDFSRAELQEMIPGLSKWRIDQARQHATEAGKSHPIPEILRLRLHGRGFQSKRFHDLETASKTTRFQRVHTEPIQPLNPTVYVKAISFSGLCTSSIGSGFDQT